MKATLPDKTLLKAFKDKSQYHSKKIRQTKNDEQLFSWAICSTNGP